MLNKSEKKVMKVLLKICKTETICLTSHGDIVKHLKSSEYLTRKEVDDILKKLVLENYIECTAVDDAGKRGYCIKLLKRGEGFVREEKDKRKVLWQRVGFTVALAVLSFGVTLLLKAIF